MLHSQTSSRFGLCALSILNRYKHKMLSDNALASVEQLVSQLWRPVSRIILMIVLNCTGQLNRCVRPANSLSNLLHHIPYRFIPLYTQSLLHVIGRNNHRRAGHQEHAGEPSMSRKLDVHHESAIPNRGLSLAIKAFPPSAGAMPTQSRGITKSETDTSIFALFFRRLKIIVFIKESSQKLVGGHGFNFETKTHPLFLHLLDDTTETDNHIKV